MAPQSPVKNTNMNTSCTYRITSLYKHEPQRPLTFSPGSPAEPTGPGLPLSPWENTHTWKLAVGLMNYLYNFSLIQPDNSLYVLCCQADRASHQTLYPPEKKKHISSYFEKTERSVSEQCDRDISSSPLLQSLLLHHGPHLHPLDPNKHTHKQVRLGRFLSDCIL